MTRTRATKPPYRVPTVAETAALPWNGLTVASTFSGGGGSCLGWRMAGYRVLWANEMVPAARDTYAANHPGTPVDPRDIRQVQPEDVLAATGLAVGELDVLEGSPPCQSFSTAGRREQGWGRVTAHADGTAQVSDDLFFEYARLLEGLRPRVFAAENVSGLVKGTAKGYFLEIMARLKECGYRVRARVLDAQWLGVPQARQRLYLVGVRDDLAADPPFPSPLPYRYSVREAVADLLADPHGRVLLEGANGFDGHAMGDVTDRPAPTVQAGRALATRVVHDDSYGHPLDVADRPAPTVRAGRARTLQVVGRVPQAWVPEHDDQAPSLNGYAIGEEWERLRPGESSNRYRHLARAAEDEPSPTVTASGGGGGPGVPGSTASVAHPTERRKFTIAELRRICGFPDDYALTGTYAEQWARLGNSVPPPMAAAVARALEPVLLAARDRTSAAT